MINSLNDYQKFILQLQEIKKLPHKPTLLLHSCCGPCSSYCIELLDQYFDLTILYYNPNIYPHDEFLKRNDELEKVIKIINPTIKIVVIDDDYQVYENYLDEYLSLEEGSLRCYQCYKMRLEKTCEYAKNHSFDYFTTTLSISPYKNSEWINEIGEKLSCEVKYLYSNFKKESGYQKSIAFCKKYDIYRQDYCGCKMSKIAHENKINK